MPEYEGRPWDRQKGESEAAYRAFLAYRDLGPGRTREAAYATTYGHGGGTKKAPAGQFTKWCDEHRWVDRCRHWDNHLQAERDRAAAERAREWERRRLDDLEDNFRVARLLREKAEKMLGFPLATTETKDGKTVVKPARWTFLTAARLIRTAADLTDSTLRAALPGDDGVCDDDAARAEIEGKLARLAGPDGTGGLPVRPDGVGADGPPA